jgi:uncharacterized lipoprotein YddW (UPF0748 family)
MHPGDFGKSEKDVENVFQRLKKCNINLAIVLVKGTNGALYWKSSKFVSAVAPGYENFDLLAALSKYSRKYGIRLHAWLCDFTEGKDSPAVKSHPEWLMRNPQGEVTTQQRATAVQNYTDLWMCPAQRPGYTDQWLLPLIEEIARNYPVDGIHHDYVRYSSIAPDSFCFCDYCLENYLRYNHFYYANRPETELPLKSYFVRPETNWLLDFTIKPKTWDRMSRTEKADFLLDGKSINRADLDYFFYATKNDMITRFVREAWERVFSINPDIEFSAAVWKNPMLNGRFLGQRWTDFAPWVDVMMPMNYREFFQGSFEEYLIYLEDMILAQKDWCEGKSHLYIGIDASYIYNEEKEPWARALDWLRSKKADQVAGKDFEALLQKNLGILERFSSPRASAYRKAAGAFLKNQKAPEELARLIQEILNDPPPGFCPEEKLLKVMAVVRKARAEGMVIFAASQLTQKKLWPALEKAFAGPAELPHALQPLENKLSIQTLRALKKRAAR